MKKYIIAASILLGSTLVAQAQSRIGYICNDNSWYSNVRSGPSAQNFPVVDSVGNNYKVQIIDITENASGFIWAKIRYDSMRYGRPSVETGWIDGSNVCLN